MKKGKWQERVLYYATHLLDRRETIQRWPTVHDLKLREGFGPCGERPTNLHNEFPKFRGSGTGRVKNDEPSKPDSGTEFKVHEDAVARVKVEGKEHLLWKRVPWNPGKGTEASLRTVQRSKAKRCEAGPVSPCNPGKGTNASLRTWKVRQVQSLESTTGPGKVQRSKAKSAGKTDPREMYPRR